MKVLAPANYGDIKNLKVVVGAVDITAAVQYIQIYQDIFTPCWSAIITVDDTTNLIQSIPVQPGSNLTVFIQTQCLSILDGSKTYRFIVYKLSDRVFKGQHEVRISFILCYSRLFEKPN